MENRGENNPPGRKGAPLWLCPPHCFAPSAPRDPLPVFKAQHRSFTWRSFPFPRHWEREHTHRGLDVPRTCAAALDQAVLLPWTPYPPLSPPPPGSSLPQLISLFITITWSWGLFCFERSTFSLQPVVSMPCYERHSTALAGGHLDMAVPFLPPWTREDRSRAVQVCVPCPCVRSELALKAAGLGAGPWMQACPLWAQEACLYRSPAGA